jgi:S1-C subfamily serine protease
VTAGIVSAKARNIGILDQPGSNMKIESFIQTDAAVNPGNSGGALVNVRGELVGINTAIASNTGNYTGYSFAVPISIVSKVVADLKQFGTVQRALLGVSIKDLENELVKSNNLSVTEGVYIESVGERSGAAEAGVKAGDVIISVNGTNVKSRSELQEQVGRYRPGDKVKVVVMRGKDQMSFAVVLKNKNGNTAVLKEKSGLEVLGAAFKEVPKELKQQFGIDYGVQVTGLMKGKFSNAGMRMGFIILRINDQKVATVQEVEQIANRIMSGNTSDQAMFISGIYPNGKTSFYAIDLSE